MKAYRIRDFGVFWMVVIAVTAAASWFDQITVGQMIDWQLISGSTLFSFWFMGKGGR